MWDTIFRCLRWLLRFGRGSQNDNVQVVIAAWRRLAKELEDSHEMLRGNLSKSHERMNLLEDAINRAIDAHRECLRREFELQRKVQILEDKVGVLEEKSNH